MEESQSQSQSLPRSTKKGNRAVPLVNPGGSLPRTSATEGSMGPGLGLAVQRAVDQQAQEYRESTGS